MLFLLILLSLSFSKTDTLSVCEDLLYHNNLTFDVYNHLNQHWLPFVEISSVLRFFMDRPVVLSMTKEGAVEFKMEVRFEIEKELIFGLTSDNKIEGKIVGVDEPEKSVCSLSLGIVPSASLSVDASDVKRIDKRIYVRATLELNEEEVGKAELKKEMWLEKVPAKS